LITVKLDSTSTTDAADAVTILKSEHHIDHLDVVIANAGIANYFGPVLTTPVDQFKEHLEVNAVGVLVLFQAVHDLLSASKNPKFVTISSPVGSIGHQELIPIPSTAYGASKAALNYLTRKIHFENPNLVVFPLSPG
jgi:norsolorinic acid ketoreductase